MNWGNYLQLVKDAVFSYLRAVGWLFYVMKLTDDPYLLDQIYDSIFPEG